MPENNFEKNQVAMDPDILKIIRASSWIKSIAVLSLINSVVFYVGGGISFVIGLGVTQLFEGIVGSMKLGTGGIVVSFIFSIFISLIFIGLSIFAKKGNAWAFWITIILYGLDTLLFFLVMDFLSIGFHLFAGWYILEGLRASLRKN